MTPSQTLTPQPGKRGPALRPWVGDLVAAGGIEVVGGAALFTIFFYQGNPARIAGWLESAVPTDRLPWVAHLLSFATALVLLVGIPAIWWKLGRKRPLSEAGLGLGDARFGLTAVGLTALAVTPLLWVNAGSPTFQNTYPLVRAAGESVRVFLLWEAIYLLYYVAWEFFFRGFWLLGLEDRMGPAAALLLQTAVSTIAHFHRPEAETLAALVAGLGFGWLALRTRSIWYLVLLHWYIGAATDLFCIIRST